VCPGSHAEWAWLTGSRVVQDECTPLHVAAQNGHTTAIKALVAAKADVHAKDSVRRGCWEGEGGDSVGFGFVSSSNLKPWTLDPNAFNERALTPDPDPNVVPFSPNSWLRPHS